MLRIALSVFASCLLAGGVFAQTAGVPLMKPPLAAPAQPAGTFRTITWESLVPPGWDPFKDFRGIDMQGLDDGDPRAAQMLKRIREAWDTAPVNQQLIGQAVRIPGFVVPLEDSKDGMKEFLLVPYFGACIHSPPPPSNQIVHVLPQAAAKGLRSMDAVWVSGVLRNTQTDSYMGASSWRIEAGSIAPYVEGKAEPKPEPRK